MSNDIPIVQVNYMERINPGSLKPQYLIILEDKKQNFVAAKYDYVNASFVKAQGVFVEKNFDVSKASEVLSNKNLLVEIDFPSAKISYARNLSFKAK